MRVKRGQGVVSIRDLGELIKICCENRYSGREGEMTLEPVLRVQPQTVHRDPAMQGKGRPRYYILSGDEIYLFPVPDDSYEIEITYYPTPKRV